MSRVAAVDVGTNTAKLLIADLNPTLNLCPRFEDRRMIRLGEGVDATGCISPAALDRLVTALCNFRDRAEALQAQHLIIAGTSASRDASRGLRHAIRARTGLRYEILSGTEEARWSFRGALAGLSKPIGQCLVLDVGGGSTEIVRGSESGGIRSMVSLNMGSVRVSERFFSSQPPAAAEWRKARSFVENELTRGAVRSCRGLPLVGASDTQRLLNELSDQAGMLTAQAIRNWSMRLRSMSKSQVLALHPGRMRGRADVFPAAVMITLAVLEHVGADLLTVSPWGLRHGLVLRLAERLGACPLNAGN